MKLTLRIQNVAEVVPALPLYGVFSQRGGIIGSGDDVTWKTQDIEGNIAESVARIVVVEERFTIESLSNANIYVNSSTSPIAQGRPVILSDKDTLSIGLLNFHVETGIRGADEDQQVSSLSSFAASNSSNNDTLIIDGEYEETPIERDEVSKASFVDPIDALAGHDKHNSNLDPLEALDIQKKNKDITKQEATEILHPSQYDGTNSTEASLQIKKVHRDRYGFEETVSDWEDDTKSINRGQSAKLNLDHPVDHVALRPLTRALGLPLGDLSSEEAATVLSDIGGALRAAVGGISEIYRDRDGQTNRFPLTTLHRHTVEDNPLRFAEDTDSALDALFAKRGAVHLSAPAAMKEAVDHFSLHQSATEDAIDKALDTVLMALSPKALEKRFHSYAPNERPETEEEKSAWYWGMYKAYFNEMKSQRQRGLQMLFWEVFQHEYQGIMRKHELYDDGADL